MAKTKKPPKGRLKKARNRKPLKAKTRGRVKEKTKKAFHILEKFQENPVISPRQEYPWEAWQTFNPGVFLFADCVHFLYRAIGEDGLSRFGYAASSDGFHIEERLSQPVYEHPIKNQCIPPFNIYSFGSGGSFGGCEDPRPVRIEGENEIFMTYTACDEGLRVALTSINVEDFAARNWAWRTPRLISPPGEVHKNWVIFPEKIKGAFAILTSISPRISISYRENLEFNDGEYLDSHYGRGGSKDGWDYWLRGAGAPPIKTEEGWLLFYHAMDKKDPGKYKVGAMLLDLNDPTRILARSPRPVLEPEEIYEMNGFKGGVVYASGAVVKDGNLLVYYGAADSFVGVAFADLNGFLEGLKKGRRPGLKKEVLKKAKSI